MAKMGLSVRDDPPKVVDLTIREWGEARNGFELSILSLPREDPDALPRLSVVIRNVGQGEKRLAVPGWLFFYRTEVRQADGAVIPLSPFGRELTKPDRSTERIEIGLAPGEFHETEIPIGSMFGLRAKGGYRVTVACQTGPGEDTVSNQIQI